MKKYAITLGLLCFVNVMIGQKIYFVEVDENSTHVKIDPATTASFTKSYLNDKNAVATVKKMEEAFIMFNSKLTLKKGEPAIVKVSSNKGEINAYYNADLVLERVEEKYRSIQIPNSIRTSIAKKYPDWAIINSKYIYNQNQDGIVKQEYIIKIQKDNAYKRLSTDSEGVALIEE